MKSTLVLLCGLIALAQGRFLSSRIVNGEDAKLGEIPYQVSLQLSKFHFCGGSILNENYIVTAAHCLESQSASNIKVVVGEVSLAKAKLEYQAEKLIIHEHYDSGRIENDVGLIKVETPIEFSELVQPVTLIESHQKVKTNATATVSGWGSLLSSGGPSPDILQKANIFIADPDYCNEALSDYGGVFETNICANDPTMRRGQCNGDSGGPLIVEGKLTGIVSWSIKDPYCASTKYPGVYTRVSEFVDWINQHAV